MQAFVTGATGLLGSNLVELLLEKGYQVKALVRSAAKAQKLSAKGQVQIVQGDITAVSQFASELAGCDVVFHCAAYFKEYSGLGSHEQALQKVNVEATLELIEACRLQGVNNFIFVSSNGATLQKKNIQATEDSGYDEQTENLYFKSKIKAEKEIDRYLHEHPKMRVIIIRPGLMIGPKDSGPTPAGQIILKFLNREMPLILPGNIVMVDARDVAAAMVTAVTSGKSGDRFIIGGCGYSMAEFAATIQAVSGIEVPKHRPPYLMTLLMLSLARMTGRNLPVRPRDLRWMRYLQASDSLKAQRVLKVQFRKLSDSLRDTVAWFKANGYVSVINED